MHLTCQSKISGLLSVMDHTKYKKVRYDKWNGNKGCTSTLNWNTICLLNKTQMPKPDH